MSHRLPGSRTRWTVIVAALSSVAAVSGCSSPAPSATAPGRSTTTTAGSSPGTTTTTAPTTASTTSTPAKGCAGPIAISVVGSQGAAGTSEVTFALRNNGATSCPLTGYPEIQLLGAGGVKLTTNSVHGGGASFTDFPPATVNLAGGATAYFNMGFSDVPTGGESSCPTATALQVTPPGASAALQVPGQYTVCNSGTVNVSPVFAAGSPQTQTTAPPIQAKVAPAS